MRISKSATFHLAIAPLFLGALQEVFGFSPIGCGDFSAAFLPEQKTSSPNHLAIQSFAGTVVAKASVEIISIAAVSDCAGLYLRCKKHDHGGKRKAAAHE